MLTVDFDRLGLLPGDPSLKRPALVTLSTSSWSV